jgi:hypothetical protein
MSYFDAALFTVQLLQPDPNFVIIRSIYANSVFLQNALDGSGENSPFLIFLKQPFVEI